MALPKGVYDFNRKWITDPVEVERLKFGHALKELVCENSKLDKSELIVELDSHDISPEWILWVRHAKCAMSVCYLVNKATRDTTITVEYPSFKDGHFVEYRCKNIPEAARVFEFGVNLLKDIRGAIDTII